MTAYAGRSLVRRRGEGQATERVFSETIEGWHDHGQRLRAVNAARRMYL